MSAAAANDSNDVVNIAATTYARAFDTSMNSPAKKAMAPAPAVVIADAKPNAVPDRPA
ncbi:hypothetical protein D3C71_2237830 [compost metagenome]